MDRGEDNGGIELRCRRWGVWRRLTPVPGDTDRWVRKGCEEEIREQWLVKTVGARVLVKSEGEENG